MLAREKALATAARHPKRAVLGADQTLALGERRFSKPPSREAAREQLAVLSGKTHELHSAAAIARGGGIVRGRDHRASHHAAVIVRIHQGISRCRRRQGFDQRGRLSIGGLGIHLFEKIEGDHFTILGLPLLPLLAYFRAGGMIAA